MYWCKLKGFYRESTVYARDKGTDKEEFMLEIDDGKSRSCIDESLKDSVEKG